MTSESKNLDYQLWRIFCLLVPVFFVCILLNLVGRHIYDQHKLKTELQQTYGENWQTKYESQHGPLAESQRKTQIGLASIVVCSGLAVGIYLTVVRRKPTPSAKKRRRSSQKPPKWM